MRKTSNTLRLLALSAAILPLSVSATNGYQLIGVGAYQKSLGGAVTAAPGSAMTAVSNPAGMARVGARADFSMEAFMPDRQVDFTGMGGRADTSAAKLYGVPAIGWVAPTSDGSDLYFGGGMYGTSGMGVDYAPILMMPATEMPSPAMYWDGYSNIAFWQMAPGFAWNVDSRLSVGVTLNLDYQSVAFKQRVMMDTTGDGQGDTLYSNFDLGRGASGFGVGLGMGVLYDVTDQLTLGFNYKSKQHFDPLEFQLGFGDISNGPGEEAPAGTYRLDLDFPQQAAVGIAFAATPALRLSADIKWIEWSDTMGKLAVTGPDGVIVRMDPGWKDQTVYALGVAYQLNRQMNLRAGYNYARTPFGADQVSHNLILPAIVESHYTMGMDYRLNRRWELGMHYMYVPEKTLTAPATDPMAPGSRISLSERSLGINIGYHF